MKRRRVLWVISSLSAGGAERMISELANAFAERGHDVAVLTLSESGSDHYRLSESVERIALNAIWDSRTPWQSLVGNWRRSQMIRHAVQKYIPDVVVSFIDQNNVRVLAALPGSGVPVIVSERTDPRRHIVGRIWNVVRRLLYPFATRIVVQTDAVAGWARRVARSKCVCVIPNFVRTLPPPVPSVARQTKAILAVGRLGREKGFDVLLQAFGQSGMAAQGIRLTVLGEGPERQRLESLADELGLAHAVKMLGVVPDPESWMAQTTVFVMPSRYEGFPNALLEAMAMGCPVIAADCDSGPGEIIQHGKNGWLVPVEDVGALATALRLFFDEESLRSRCSREAVKVREIYSKTVIVGQWENLIEEVVKK